VVVMYACMRGGDVCMYACWRRSIVVVMYACMRVGGGASWW